MMCVFVVLWSGFLVVGGIIDVSKEMVVINNCLF